MSGRETQRKGDLAKAKAIAYFTEQGYEVGLLITESAPYDLVVDDGTLHRVQVKYTSSSYVDMRRIHSNSTGYVIKEYGKYDFDWLLVYTPTEGIYLIKDAAGKKYVPLFLHDAVKYHGRLPESGLTDHS